MKFIPLIGRVLFSAMFIMFGIGHFTDGQAMIDGGMVPSFLPFPMLIVIATGVVLVLGGVAVLVGYRTKEAALGLAVFLLATTFLTWAPMLSTGGQQAMTMFMKDMSLAGAALLLSHFGAGPMSLDAKQSGE
ncbi:MAG: DoxX family protein [Bacteroidetes Order II. Incertae sedis bacterium]|jgi:putative oxidoreductase|nr:DoxX family protein [Bacteroidetes Order II. bacterium]MBT4052251.1 DoxX family protein [Bacteroidetes Order II. bacterium]MBT4603681.1 DoxX family protein [Bacteroidetes Order II. bacterium]MBT5248561.1 DoxX family protein [Bacteroidetes Order II. bacterium]MBT6199922.1 DoxX family protein [Bacteroidetes Order II. bacterium]